MFTTFPELETERLILRRITPKDNLAFFEMRNDPRMIEFTDSKIDETLADTNSYIELMNKGVDEGKWIIWAIQHKQAKKVIGSISIWNIKPEKQSAELGFGTTPEYQNQGFMKEALLAATAFGFDVMELNALEAYTEEQDKNAIKLLESCEFLAVNKIEEAGYYSDRVYHMIVFRRENNK